MKKIKFLLVFVLTFAFGLECVAQIGPVFNYTSPSKSELEKFALAPTKKSFEYRSLLVSAVQKHVTFKVTESNVSWIFDQLTLEEVTLEEGSYQNSGWNTTTQKMETSTGHAYHGFVWVFRYNGISFPLIKGNCGNILLCDAFEAVAQTVPVAPVAVDTIHIKKVVVVETTEVVSNPNEKIASAGRTVTVGYGATNYPDNQYYSGYGQPCGGVMFFVGYNNYGGCRPYYSQGRYVNNNYPVNYGAVNKPYNYTPNPQGNGGQGSMSGPRPSNGGQGTMSTGRTVTVGYGGGNGSSGGGRGH